MATYPAPIDGYDWDIADEPPTYPVRARQDACTRAARWRQEQAPHLYPNEGPHWELVDPTSADDGWLHVGNVIEWNAERLRVCWHPATDDVQLEAAPPPPPGPITFTATVRTSFEAPDIRVWLRLLSAPGRDALTFPTVAMTLARPADMTPGGWKWTTTLAGHRMIVVTLPDSFLDTPPSERLPLFREAVSAALRQIPERDDRRR